MGDFEVKTNDEDPSDSGFIYTITERLKATGIDASQIPKLMKINLI